MQRKAERMVLHRLDAPFEPEHVMALNRFQHCEITQPFTCRVHLYEPLVATPRGWVCSVIGCSYRRNWAWKEMLVDPVAPMAGNA